MAHRDNPNFGNQNRPFLEEPRCPTLTTERLTLRMLRPDDQEFLAWLDADRDVMQFIHSGPLTKARARRFAELQIELAPTCWHLHKWLVERTEDHTRLGWVEVTTFQQDHKRQYWGDDLQIGYQFAPAYWQAGYATEAGRAVVAYGFTVLAPDRLVAFARPDNRSSVRVLEKLGFTQDGYCQDGGGHPCAFYVLTQDAWHRQERS